MSENKIILASFESYDEVYEVKTHFAKKGIASEIVNSAGSGSFLEESYDLVIVDKDSLRAVELFNQMKQEKRVLKGCLRFNPSINRILVPTDFSTCSLNAALYAAEVARQKGARLHLLHVYFNPISNPVSFDHFYSFPANVTESVREIVDYAKDQMSHFCDKFSKGLSERGLSNVDFDSNLIGGIAEESVVDYAEAGNYDLLIMGVHPKESKDGWFGSFMTEVIARTKIPVLAVPESSGFKRACSKKLMYATNFDKSDGTALVTLVDLVQPLDCSIDIVHIDEKEDHPFTAQNITQFKENLPPKLTSIAIQYNLIINKSRSKAIEDYIANHDIDILAVTSHKRNLITSLLHPSLARELLFKLKVPMLVFHGQ